MVNIDLPIALSIFLVFFVTTIVFAVNYVSKIPSLNKIDEFRSKAQDLYTMMFESEGIPEDWEKTGTIPAFPGVMTSVRKIPILINETNSSDRIDETISINITFDEDCENKAWNNTVRIHGNDLNDVAFNLTEQDFCSSQFLKSANFTFIFNISANQTKKFEIYFSDEQNITASNNTIAPTSLGQNLTIFSFPEDEIEVTSFLKVDALKNATFDEIIAIGQGYKFRVEIEDTGYNESYGESESSMQGAMDIGCYEAQKLLENPDGLLNKVDVKICVWK